MKFLFIDFISNRNFPRLEVYDDDLCLSKRREKLRPSNHSELLWSLLQKAMLYSQVQCRDIEAIVVVKGPGSFFAVRSAVSVGNALAYALHIPVIGILRKEMQDKFFSNTLKKKIVKSSMHEWIEPVYEQKPNITRAQGVWS